MIIKKAYIDIEAIYCGDIDPDKSQDDKTKFFRDFENWKFFAEKEYNGNNIVCSGMIGVLLLELDFDKKTNIHRLINKRFIQLIGKDCNRENLMKELDNVTEVLGYHCRTKPSGQKGYIGYDFGVIGAQLGIILDEQFKCIDLELLAHSVGMYGGLKKLELLIPTIIPRKSGVKDGLEAVKLLLDIASENDKIKKKEMWKKVKMYNREDVVNLVYIEQYLRKIRVIE